MGIRRQADAIKRLGHPEETLLVYDAAKGRAPWEMPRHCSRKTD